jgi:hypothetical protein
VSSPSASSAASWSEINAVYQNNVDASSAALRVALSRHNIVTPPSSPDLRFLEEFNQPSIFVANYDEYLAPPPIEVDSPALDITLAQVARYELDTLDCAAYVTLGSPGPSSPYVNNEEIPIEVLDSPILRAAVATVPSPAPPTRPTSPIDYNRVATFPSPTAVPVRRPTPVFVPASDPILDNIKQEDEFPDNYFEHDHLFAEPPCAQEIHVHPHQYHVTYEGDKATWCPAEYFANKDILGRLHTHDQLAFQPVFRQLLPFRGLIFHVANIEAISTLPSLPICARVGYHPPSLVFPVGYLEVDFVESIKYKFAQFPRSWLQHFNGSKAPLKAYDFLGDKIFAEERYTKFEDELVTKPYLYKFVAQPRVPADPFTCIEPPALDKPL